MPDGFLIFLIAARYVTLMPPPLHCLLFSLPLTFLLFFMPQHYFAITIYTPPDFAVFLPPRYLRWRYYDKHFCLPLMPLCAMPDAAAPLTLRGGGVAMSRARQARLPP